MFCVVTVVCGFYQKVLQSLVSYTSYLQRNLWVLLPFWIFQSFIYQFIEWLSLNIEMLNKTTHVPMCKWSQHGLADGLVPTFGVRASAATISMVVTFS